MRGGHCGAMVARAVPAMLDHSESARIAWRAGKDVDGGREGGDAEGAGVLRLSRMKGRALHVSSLAGHVANIAKDAFIESYFGASYEMVLPFELHFSLVVKPGVDRLFSAFQVGQLILRLLKFNADLAKLTLGLQKPVNIRWTFAAGKATLRFVDFHL